MKQSNINSLDVMGCDQEPIHLPGAIQPHGLLFVLAEPALTIAQISENVGDVLGIPTIMLLGKSFADSLLGEDLPRLRQVVAADDPRVLSPVRLHLLKGTERLPFDGIVHRHAGRLVVELEPASSAELSFFSLYHSVRQSVQELQKARTILDACRFTAEQVKEITGFHRVLIYQFDEEWNGNVLAEVREDLMPSYLGLRFPAADIPVQARTLYTINRLRLIVDADYRPARILPERNPQTGKPLDLSYGALRSVSPVHIEYMKNMKTMSSMSISIMKNGALWGLISCHHEKPKYVAYQTRTACDFLGQILSYQLTAIESRSDFDFRASLRDMLGILAERVSTNELIQALTEAPSNLMELLDSGGAALLLRGSLFLVGKTPLRGDVEALVTWLQRDGAPEIFQTNALATIYAPAKGFEDVASGLLALPISKSRDAYLMWFRPEIVRTVAWGGNPEKSVESEADHLHPRKSFELWKQTVRGKAVPWQRAEIDAAKDVRSTIITEELAKVNGDLSGANRDLKGSNEELAISNAELDAFAYIAAHDLKEPVRSIRTYLSFVLDDERDNLSEKSKARLTAANQQGERMTGLLSSLFHYSRVGRVDLALTNVDLNETLKEVLRRLSTFLEEHAVEVTVERPLPIVRCDGVRVGEIFYNLIMNAAKYNESAVKSIAIGYKPGANGAFAGQPVIHVRDNGIGIPPLLQASVFTMYKRLHANDKYGGGTGTGLTIAKKVVERHGGRIWLESAQGAGTTFFFTLGDQNAK